MSERAAPSELMPLGERTRVLLPGLYAWLLTVELPALARGAEPWARVTALVALGSLVAALFFVGGRLTLARILGIYAFIGFSALTWALLSGELSPLRADRIRAALGSLGFVLYAFGWGRVRGTHTPEDEPNALLGAPLVPRSRLDPRTLPVAACAVVAALTFEALAFRVDRPEHAVFAHATAAACALVVLATSAKVALAQGTRGEPASGTIRLNAVAVRGAVLSILFGLGLVWAAFK
ncbi:MAG TPA: hypothetical protein VGQ57_19145 [Polyangiaceae bacterium]|nr:hypothetical protein [Polyangiaceae bacterium]